MMNRSTYLALVHKDPDSAWGLTFPDLPGCFSAADEEDAIMANAMEALELYAEDLEALPASRGIDALSQDHEVAAELASGAFLMAIPFIRNTQRTKRVNITLPKGLLDAIDDEAARRKMTRSALMVQAAEREVLGHMHSSLPRVGTVAKSGVWGVLASDTGIWRAGSGPGDDFGLVSVSDYRVWAESGRSSAG